MPLRFVNKEVMLVFLGLQIWDFSEILPDKQFPGILLKILFAYKQKLYLAQALGYILFWLLISGLYFRSLNQPTPLKPVTKIN
jgi:high-affinity iron transporter